MNPFDIFVLIVICLMTFYGVWKGFIKQALGILGIVVGYFVAISHYGKLAAYIKLNDSTLSNIVSFIILFLGCVIVFAIISVILNKFFKLPGLGIINTFLGGVTGFIKGFIIVALSAILLIVLLSPENPVLKKSATLPYVLRLLALTEKAIPPDIRAQCRKKIDAIIKNLQATPAEKK